MVQACPTYGILQIRLACRYRWLKKRKRLMMTIERAVNYF